MSARRHPFGGGVGPGCVVAFALALGGCVSLLPKTKPAQLYRFEVAQPARVSAPAAAIAVRLSDIDFTAAAAGDAILTMRGDEAAYIAGARWLSPASTLFETAVRDAFARGGPVRLLAPGELAPAAYSLKLDVRHFEVDYDQPGEAPTIHIELDAALMTASGAPSDRTAAFAARVPASADRVSAIVAAFDTAMDRITGELAAWVGGGASVGAPPTR